MKVKRRLIFVLAIFFLAIVGGAFSYHFVEGWSLLDSFYFVVVTVTTIGYGDFVPITVQGKIFTMFFAFFGVGTALYIFTIISGSIFKKHVRKHIRRSNGNSKVEKVMENDIKDIVKKAIKKR